MAHVVSIVYTPASVPDLRPGERYARVSAGRVRLVEGHGIEGDAKGGPGRRQVNLMAARTHYAVGIIDQQTIFATTTILGTLSIAAGYGTT